MMLDEKDAKEFVRLHQSLLVHASRKLDTKPRVDSISELRDITLEEAAGIRDALMSKPALIDSFAEENPARLSNEDLATVRGWKRFVHDKFYVAKYRKQHAVFLGGEKDPRAYAVLGITTDLRELIGPYLPVLVETYLLPFRGRIVYDGFLGTYNVTFGGGARRSVEDALREAEGRHGLITSLEPGAGAHKTDKATLLKAYLGTASMREMHEDDIDKMTRKEPALLALYHQEMGKVHARAYRKTLKGAVRPGTWFAMVDGVPVASGRTREELVRNLRGVVPGEREAHAYVFQV